MRFYVTVRCVNRAFRLVPTRKVRKAVRYALAATLQQYRERGLLVLHDFVFMSNHYHLLGTDLRGCLPDFMRDLNSVLSRELNAQRGIKGTNFETYDFVIIGDDERLIEHSVYTGANPVAAFLVDKATKWCGVSSAGMRYGVPIVVEKPSLGMWAGKCKHAAQRESRRSGRATYAGRSTMPDTAELVIDRPDVRPDLTDDELRDLIERRLAVREEELDLERRRRGLQWLGNKRAMARHFQSLPSTEELFAPTPTVSASTAKDRSRLREILHAFWQAYETARDAFCSGRYDTVFPYGTWLMPRRFNVACLAAAA